MQQLTDPACESVVLGALINSTANMPQAREILSPDCFSVPANREIYSALQHLDSHGLPADSISIVTHLAKSGSFVTPLHVIDLTEQAAVGDCTHLMLHLRELALRRSIATLALRLSADAQNQTVDLDDILSGIRTTLASLTRSSAESVETLKDAYLTLRSEIAARTDPAFLPQFTPSGFPELDSRGILAPDSLIIIAAESSVGKTSLATAIALGAVAASHPVAYYSLEMSATRIAARIAAMRSGIPAADIHMQPLPSETRLQLDRAMESLPAQLMFFDDSATTSLDRLIASIRSLTLRHSLRGVVIDYLQILNINSRADSPEQLMAIAARRLKNTAKELGIWIIALSQLNRSTTDPRRVPSVNRLRGSGQILETADTAITIYRPEAVGVPTYPPPYSGISVTGTALINAEKGRDTGTFSFICAFDPSTTLFSHLDTPPLADNQVEPYADSPDEDMPF